MREFALIPMKREKEEKKKIKIVPTVQKEKEEKKESATSGWQLVRTAFLFFFFSKAGRHNHTNKTSKIDSELKYAVENYSDCSGMAGRKIFPQSVRLHEIKTHGVIPWDRRRNEKETFRRVHFSLVSGPWQLLLFMSLVNLTGGKPRHVALFFWSLANSSPVCCLAMWTLLPCRVVKKTMVHTHTHTHTRNKPGVCLWATAKCCTCVMCFGLFRTILLSTCTLGAGKIHLNNHVGKCEPVLFQNICVLDK